MLNNGATYAQFQPVPHSHQTSAPAENVLENNLYGRNDRRP